MAPVVDALRGLAPEIDTRVAFTGQHTSLVDGVLAAFQMQPDYDLAIMADDQTLYDVVHRALDGLREVVRDLAPEMILVQGDTATVFVGSLVGFFEQVAVGHVEAGLRSGDKRAPFPEEVFRRLTDVIADHHFAPTRRARDLLLQENAPAHRVHITGNTVVDALRSVASLERSISDDALREVVLDEGRRLVLLTAHRRESFGAPLREALAAVRELADEVEDVAVVYPVHPNPNVRRPAEAILSGHPRIHLTEPLDYFDLIGALQHAALVLTDSGGIQEETTFLGVPCLTARESTERPATLTHGTNRLVPLDRSAVLDLVDRLVEDAPVRGDGAAEVRVDHGAGSDDRRGVPPLWDGRAAQRIADILLSRRGRDD